MNLYHLIYASIGRLPFFTSANGYHSAIRALAKVSKNRIVAFAVMDDHIHVVLFEDSGAERHRAKALLQALSPLTSVGIERAHIVPIESRIHMHRELMYMLRQPSHHKLKGHEALWRGSCFPDLVGARYVEGLQLQVEKALPRFNVGQILGAMGVQKKHIIPLENAEIKGVGLSRFIDCAIDALCAPSPLSGKSYQTIGARAAVCQLAHAAGFKPAEVADSLNISRQSFYSALKRTVASEAIQSIRVRLNLENSKNRNAR